MNLKSTRYRSLKDLFIFILILVFVNVLSQYSYKRLDLTSDKRYTLSDITKSTLKDLNEVIFIQIYLDGDLPLGFSRFKSAIREILDEYSVYGKKNIQFEFIDPYKSKTEEEQNLLFKELVDYGIDPVNVRLSEKGGNYSEKILFPGAIINYRNKKNVVNLLRNNPALSADQNLNFSIEGLEYEFTNSIQNIIKTEFPYIAFIEGHGELDEYETADITNALSEFYNIDRVILNGQVDILDLYDAVIIAKPTESYPEKDKFVVDQYIMNGGKVIWLIDQVYASMDSLSKGNTTLGLNMNLNLQDQLFKYKIRINPVFIQDIQCLSIPVNMALSGQNPKWVPTPWLYSPIIAPGSNNPISKGLNMIKTEFVNSIDILEDESNEIKSTIILTTSPYTKILQAPMLISLGDINKAPDEKDFVNGIIPIAVLQEGIFESVFTNRMIKDYLNNTKKSFKAKSVNTSMIFISDGDIIRNELTYTSGGIMIRPLGYDKYSNQTFGNKLFIKNCIDYLCNESELINLRSRDFKLRILNKAKISSERLKWQIINVIFPLLFIVISGLVYLFFHRRKYTR